jgi:hypothetical protein
MGKAAGFWTQPARDGVERPTLQYAIEHPKSELERALEPGGLKYNRPVRHLSFLSSCYRLSFAIGHAKPDLPGMS